MRKPRKQQQATAPAGPETSTTRRRWTALEKSRIVRQHLRDGIAVAELAEQTGAAPGLIDAPPRPTGPSKSHPDAPAPRPRTGTFGVRVSPPGRPIGSR